MPGRDGAQAALSGEPVARVMSLQARTGVTVLAAALAAALLGLGIPRTVAAGSGFAGWSALRSLAARRVVLDDELQRAVSGLLVAVRWVPSSGRLEDLARLETVQAQRLPPGDPRRPPLVQSAESHARLAIARTPINRAAWVTLVILLDLRDAPRREIAAALVKLLDVAPYDRDIWLWRSGRLLGYWDELAPEERQGVESNIRVMWTADRPMATDLLRYAVLNDRLGPIELALGRDREALAVLDKLRAENPGSGR
jgi:hypothetical protein